MLVNLNHFKLTRLCSQHIIPYVFLQGNMLCYPISCGEAEKILNAVREKRAPPRQQSRESLTAETETTRRPRGPINIHSVNTRFLHSQSIKPFDTWFPDRHVLMLTSTRSVITCMQVFSVVFKLCVLN